jgi:hypothetical protein
MLRLNDFLKCNGFLENGPWLENFYNICAGLDFANHVATIAQTARIGYIRPNEKNMFHPMIKMVNHRICLQLVM